MSVSPWWTINTVQSSPSADRQITPDEPVLIPHWWHPVQKSMRCIFQEKTSKSQTRAVRLHRTEERPFLILCGHMRFCSLGTRPVCQLMVNVLVWPPSHSNIFPSGMKSARPITTMIWCGAGIIVNNEDDAPLLWLVVFIQFSTLASKRPFGVNIHVD